MQKENNSIKIALSSVDREILEKIKEEVNIPVKYVGLGEQEDDLEAFDIEKYIYGLFKDL